MLNITINTFKEIMRNKFLYLILFFAFCFIIFSISLGKLTIGDAEKVIVDFGLSMIEIFGIVGVLFVGSQLLFREIEGKTIFLLLSKPIRRYEFILGKFLGFSLCIFLIIFFQSILFLGVLLLKNIEIDYLIVLSLFFTFLKLEILLSLVFFFSTFISNILTILVSLMVYLVSHSFSLILDLITRLKNDILISITYFFQSFFPPLEALNTKDIIGSFTNFYPGYFMFNTIYSLFYLSLILLFTIFIFNKKSFEN